MRSQLKFAVDAKQIKGEDGKMVKPSAVVKKIIDAWNSILNSSTKELYVEFVMHFRRVCVRYPNFLKYVNGTIFDQVKENIVCS